MCAKLKTMYVCSNCGYSNPKWSGKCPECDEWNTMEESVVDTAPQKNSSFSVKTVSVSSVTEIELENEHRYNSGISELDRVLGGGIVKGSAVLLSGEPGIGKSTILFKLRAKRLNVENPNLSVMSENDAEAICEYIHSARPQIVIVDSIQTMHINELNSSSGSISQVRECTNLFMRTAKSLDIPIFIVGHVNKDGGIAGPKVMEHIVDAVLYFEGDRNYSYRILRATKNRFGSTNEIGVFEMLDNGLHEVKNPSEMLLSSRSSNISGTCVACTIEGSRPILAEIQSLVCTTGFGTPRRMATGFDMGRMNLILAVLEKRIGLFYANLDVYLNIVGGLRLDEPATDLSIALSLVSALKDMPVPHNVAVFGEVGLTGEIRSVPHALDRIKEAARLGFTKVIVPENSVKQFNLTSLGIEVVPVKHLYSAIAEVFG